jgi:hypothetical protein
MWQPGTKLNRVKSRSLSAVHACSRISLAFIWFWHGLVPKLLFPQTDERAILAASFMSPRYLGVIGAIEIAFSALTLLSWRRKSFFIINIVVMIGVLVDVAIVAPSYLSAAFNPVTLNVAMIALSIVGYIAGIELFGSSHLPQERNNETPSQGSTNAQ